MAVRQLPSREFLNKLLTYEPRTGKLYWKRRSASFFEPIGDLSAAVICRRWNGKNAGREAFTCTSHGYHVGRIGPGTLRAHRVIWKLVTGIEPKVIDHINGDRQDNRWDNLRSVTGAVNAKNTAMNPRNTSGVTGVSWAGHMQRWASRIKADGRQMHLGYYHCFGLAIKARRDVEAGLGFSERHGREATAWSKCASKASGNLNRH